uniref:Major facilitator superfamily (MFS) profile domain-containing protein n=1 Tax=Ditylenchus dipsaci TaxID=166011 RepID=A0A915DUJ4_9BILA
MLTLLAVSLITLAVKFEVVMMLLLGRFLSALSSGISMCALILFLQEISSAEMRGQLSFFAEMAFVSMNALGVIMGMSSVLGNHLTYLVALALVPAIVSIVILLPLHETPKYLLLKRKDKTSATSAINFYLGTS